MGVGAQKAATTWLFRQLIKPPNFKTGLMKEYHLFDELYVFQDGVFKQTAPQRIKNYPFNDSPEFQAKGESLASRFYKNPESYFDYFESILTEDASFSLDITPSYCGLPIEAFKRIRSAFNSRNIKVKVLYILREPVTRLESALKMQLSWSGSLAETNSAQMLKLMGDTLNSDQVCPRDNYRLTWSRLHQAFAPDEIFVGFFETLFTDDEIKRLAAFLELDSDLFDVSTKTNISKAHFLHSEYNILLLKNQMLDQYDFVEKQLGFDLAHWDEALKRITADSC